MIIYCEKAKLVKFSAQGLEEAKDKLHVMKLSEEEQKAYNNYLESLHDRASFYDSTYGQGLNKGLMEGEIIGTQKGREEGEAIGIRKGLQKAYKNLVAGGMEPAQAKKLLNF